MTPADSDPIEVGDVVQIDPAHDPYFAACLMTVVEVTDRSVRGAIATHGRGGITRAYYRAKLAHVRRVGKAAWIVGG